MAPHETSEVVKLLLQQLQRLEDNDKGLGGKIDGCSAAISALVIRVALLEERSGGRAMLISTVVATIPSVILAVIWYLQHFYKG